MQPLPLILACALAAVPPLTDDQRRRLAGARDGDERRGDAFAALLDNVRRWTDGLQDAPIRLHPDFDLMLASPEGYRGELCRITGVIQQQSPLEPPRADLVEWFVRDDGGRPILLFMYGLPPDHGFRPGEPVVIPARFYKHVDAVALDGRVHRYPAFVGAFPARAVARGGPDGWGGLWAVTVPVAIMMAVFLMLLIYARRGGGPPRVRAGPRSPVGMVTDLPENPAEALAELRRRAAPEER